MSDNTKTILTGSQAVAEAMRQLRADVVPIYPITPQTEIIETFANYVAAGKSEAEIVRAESEHAVMGIAVGAATAGARVMTATASQGLALMWEVLGVASGLRQPIVMALGNRTISAPINIHCDHSDSMGARDLGWIQIFSENVQEVYDNMLLVTKIAEDRDIQLPAMVLQDGFVTTHCLENLEILPDDTAHDFVGERYVQKSALDVDSPSTFGAVQLPNSYMETAIERHEALLQAQGKYLEYGAELSALTVRSYPLFELYEQGKVVPEFKETDIVLIFANSTAGTAKEAVDKLRGEGMRIGLLKPRLFRPFPYAEIRSALKNVKKVLCYDRSLSFGAESPLSGEFQNALYELREQPEFSNIVYGLGGRDVTVEDIVKMVKDNLS